MFIEYVISLTGLKFVKNKLKPYSNLIDGDITDTIQVECCYMESIKFSIL